MMHRDGDLYYWTGKSTQTYPDLLVPFLGIDRPWMPNERLGISPVNGIATMPLERWRVLGTEDFGGERAIKVEIEPHEPFDCGRDGRLNVAQVFIAWFLPERGYALRRAEQQMRYRIGEKTFRSDWKLPPTVYEATEFQQFREMWFPTAGKVESYYPDLEEPVEKPDWDKIADELLATEGKSLTEGMLQAKLTTRREWHVVDLKSLEPQTKLWFDAPDGAVVMNSDDDTHYVPAASGHEVA